MTMCSVQCVSIDWLISARVGLNSYVRTSEVNRLICLLMKVNLMAIMVKTVFDANLFDDYL